MVLSLGVLDEEGDAVQLPPVEVWIKKLSPEQFEAARRHALLAWQRAEEKLAPTSIEEGEPLIDNGLTEPGVAESAASC